MSIARHGAADVVVAAPPGSVWRVVSDVTRTGEWSGECRAVEWAPGATRAAPGVRFRGHNRSGWLRWSRTCEVTSVESPSVLTWRTVPSPLFPDSCEWRIELAPAGTGTRIRIGYRVTLLPRWLAGVLGVLNPSHADRNDALGDDLRRLGEVAAVEATSHIRQADR